MGWGHMARSTSGESVFRRESDRLIQCHWLLVRGKLNSSPRKKKKALFPVSLFFFFFPFFFLTGSTGWAILQSARSCCRLSRERLLHPLHLLRPVLLGCCRLQLTSLSSMIVLQPPFLCEGWGGHPLCLSGDNSVLMDLYWTCDFTAQSGVLSTGSVFVVLLWGIFLNDLGQ